MGDIRVAIGTPDTAREDYRKCLELDPGNALGIQCKKKMNAIQGPEESPPPDETEEPAPE